MGSDLMGQEEEGIYVGVGLSTIGLREPVERVPDESVDGDSADGALGQEG